MSNVPDSSLVEDALVTLLLNDSKLKSLMPDGVFWDQARDPAKRFVIVSMVDEDDEAVFDENRPRAIEDYLFLVKAVALVSTGANIKAAAHRIDKLLEDEDLQIEGYSLMTMHRETRVKYTEVDEVEQSIRWQHRGGRYRIQVALT